MLLSIQVMATVFTLVVVTIANVLAMGDGGYGGGMGGHGGGMGRQGSGMGGYGGGMGGHGNGIGGYGGGMGMPKPYNFGYQAPGYGSNSHRSEKGDGSGNVMGSYGYTDSQGLYRNVEYTAGRAGFQAKVMTNEPGTKDGRGESPADVALMAQKAPAGIQEKYTRMGGMGGGYGGMSGGMGGGHGGMGGGYGGMNGGMGGGHSGMGGGRSGMGGGHGGMGGGYGGMGGGYGGMSGGIGGGHGGMGGGYGGIGGGMRGKLGGGSSGPFSGIARSGMGKSAY